VPRYRWEDNIKMELKETGFEGTDCSDLAQERKILGSWEGSNGSSGSIKCREFLD
jgi:hypothetical protein